LARILPNKRNAWLMQPKKPKKQAQRLADATEEAKALSEWLG
jgi:hypothetical protein